MSLLVGSKKQFQFKENATSGAKAKNKLADLSKTHTYVPSSQKSQVVQEPQVAQESKVAHEPQVVQELLK